MMMASVTACSSGSSSTGDTPTDTPAPETTQAVTEASETSASETQTEPVTEAETSAPETTAEPETETTAETEDAPAADKAPAYDITLADESELMADDGNTKLFESKLQQVSISAGSGYDKLAEAVDGHNKVRRDAYDYTCTNMKEDVQTHYADPLDSFSGEWSMMYYVSDEDRVYRCDSSVFSYMSSEEGYSGGAHGWNTSVGMNFDAQTGAELTAADICTDLPRLVDILADKLEKEYGEAVDPSWIEKDSYKSLLTYRYGEDLMGYDDTWDDGSVYHMSAMDFVFVPDGVMFFTDQYDIAPYAAGTQSLTVLFSEEEGLFNEKYISSGADFEIKSEGLYLDMRVDIDGDGKGERFSVKETFDDDWNITGYVVKIGDTEHTIDDVGPDERPVSELIRKDGKYTYRMYSRDGDLLRELEL